ncbi:MAG: metal-dependent hydrolase, partial [Acidobacteriota bacterium]|nr:metal-dependent hydrolase [Acidobacteriota bacterium]
PLPVAHGAVGAGLVALVRARSSVRHDWKMLAVGALLAISPDLDFFFLWVLHLRGWHRGFTHSVTMAVVVTALLFALLGRRRARDAVAYGLALLSHGLLDFATTKNTGGVELLWPFSSARFRLGLIDFLELPNGYNLSDIIKYSLVELVVFVPFLLLVLLLREYMFPKIRSA